MSSDPQGDLAQLLLDLGTPVRSTTPLSRKASRLELADGRVLKGVRLQTATQAGDVETLVRALDRPFLASVLARHGRAILTEWVDGTSLGGAEPDLETFRRCGALLTEAHARAVPLERAEPPESVIRGSLRRMRQHLEDLERVGLDGLPGARRLRDIIESTLPAACSVGFVLGDYCAENLVRRPDGEFCLIDIESVSIDAVEYDLGRTWYRWPMRRAELEAFFEGYGEARAFFAHFPYWALLGLIESAWYRSRYRRETISVPLERLHRLVLAVERGMSPEEAVFGA